MGAGKNYQLLPCFSIVRKYLEGFKQYPFIFGYGNFLEYVPLRK